MIDGSSAPGQKRFLAVLRLCDQIGGLTISDPPTQAEVQALRDKTEELADDVRALAALACRGVARGASGDRCMRCEGRWLRWGW